MVEENPLISVIVPICNAESSLNECVESIVRQTYRDLDIILVDDGSSDRCPELCERWAYQDPRIRVIHQSNAGASAARNAGIAVARGTYLGFVDSDDRIADTMYETLLGNLLREYADVSIIGTSLVGEDGRAYVPCEKHCYLRMDSAQAFKYVNIPGYFHVAVWDKLYRRELFDDIRFPVERCSGEDYPVTYRVLDKARTLIYDSAPPILLPSARAGNAAPPRHHRAKRRDRRRVGTGPGQVSAVIRLYVVWPSHRDSGQLQQHHPAGPTLAMAGLRTARCQTCARRLAPCHAIAGDSEDQVHANAAALSFPGFVPNGACPIQAASCQGAELIRKPCNIHAV